MKNNKTHYVYALVCPIDNSIKYIGLSVNPAARAKGHNSCNDGSPDKIKWLSNLREKKLKPSYIILGKEKTRFLGRILEKACIEEYAKAGHPLFNSKMNPSRPNPRMGRNVEQFKELQSLADKNGCSMYELEEYKGGIDTNISCPPISFRIPSSNEKLRVAFEKAIKKHGATAVIIHSLEKSLLTTKNK